ncbi:MAG: Clp protease ClpP [Oscillospiraceae bacterium]|jgi:ATP-dependent Clp protease protease subunit|nr:Clp protease ClpP [Oscillospiraceae bacterium]
MKKFWNFKTEENGRTLELIGEIAKESWFGDEVTPKEFKNELNGGSGDISVFINSPGGDIFAASEIYTALKEYSKSLGKVSVIIDALAASAASVIAMSGDEVKMSPTAYLMIHNPWTFAAGDSDEMRVIARQLDEIKEGVINAYKIKSGLSRERISQMMDAEMYVSAAEAVRLGLADEILFENEEFLKEDRLRKDYSKKDHSKEDFLKAAVAFSQKMAINQVLARIRGKPLEEEKEKKENKEEKEMKEKEAAKTDYGKYKEILNKLKLGGKAQ